MNNIEIIEKIISLENPELEDYLQDLLKTFSKEELKKLLTDINYILKDVDRGDINDELSFENDDNLTEIQKKLLDISSAIMMSLTSDIMVNGGLKNFPSNIENFHKDINDFDYDKDYKQNLDKLIK